MIESALVGGITGDTGRIGGYWSVAGLDATTVDGTNTSLNDPITQAARDLGYSLVDFTSLADADLTTFTADQWTALLDVSTLYCLRKIEGSYTKFDETVGPKSQQLSQRRDGYEQALKYWANLCLKKYGIGLMTMAAQVGTPSRGFPVPSDNVNWGLGQGRTDH